ncbi:T9SS type A sorting domain-containing protein [Prevotella sp.]|uniref:T9SS type A sorting domain-containing protein n=1 Tax=Prevotella sp. TaxID=59823 RepID=UPI001CB63604|nr:T9SS type A sorting domain-containing protein [Prevotella sp.]MBF1640172.1 T9SS type A sorting domain-containing protein [Prevotella sp.]
MKRKNFFSRNGLKFYALISLLLLCNIGISAQTDSKAVKVTISPQTGNIISVRSESSLEAGSQSGYGSMFIHNQAPLTYTTTDNPKFSADGMMRNHTGNIRFYENHKRMVHITGVYNSYAALAVPKGFRITKYTIKIKNNLQGSYGRADYDILDGAFDGHLTWGRNLPWYFGEIKEDYIKSNNNPNSIQTHDENATKWVGSPVRLTHDASGQSKTYTLTRGDGTTSLGSVLYFTFIGNHNYIGKGYNVLTGFEYESIEVEYAPDVEFTVSMTPSNVSETNTNLVENGFETQKIDVGEIKKVTKAGKTFLAYVPENIKQMEAKVKLFHESAVENGTWKKKDGTNEKISVVQNDGKVWNALKSGIYYIEGPTKVENNYKDGTTKVVPIGYRITGATFNFSLGKNENYGTKGFKIKGDNNKYLTFSSTQYPKWSTSTQATTWEQDSEGYVYTKDVYGNTQYLAMGASVATGTFYVITTTSRTSAYRNWYFDSEGNLYNSVYRTRYYLQAYGSYAVLSYYDRSTFYGKRESAGASYTPQTYTIKVYDKTGKTVYQEVSVAPSASNGSITIDGLNNDAVKFEIANTTGTALVNVDVKMEPLNPYISTADIVCTGEQGEEMTRTFTNAVDFKMGGDLFEYKVPAGFSTPAQGTFTFRNLKSLFADDTYLNCDSHDGKARYSFVGSVYTPVNGKDLYASNYDPNHSYLDKIDVKVAGNKAFIFNNSAQLDRNRNTQATLYLEETPFSDAAYSSQGGNFNPQNSIVPMNDTKTLYLFTKDETRYNIAPTVKEQHEAFAYYTATIKLTPGEYTPKVEWVKIYDKTNYYKADNDQDNEEAMYGAKITTTAAGFDTESGNSYGYLTLSQIKNAMTAALGGTNAPTSLDQVLYVDNSQLFSVIGSTNDASTGIMSMNTFRDALAKNAIVYLPYRSAAQATANNVAVAKQGSTSDFTSPVEFKLIDKNPFFAPYDIKLADDKFATYERKMTYNGYGADTYASIVLPFKLTVDTNGDHKDDNGGFFEFTVGKMKENGLTYTSTPQNQGTDYQATAQFEKLNAATEANKSYMVRLPRANASNNILFTVREKAALIEKTASNDNFIEDGMINNILNGATANFKSYHTYSGLRMNKADKPNVFYFSYNKFVALRNLRKEVLYLWPFRAAYEFSSSAGAKMFSMFNISFDENNTETTGITDIANEPTLAITTTYNTIIATANKDTDLKIYNAAGQNITRTVVKSGETRTFSVPTGLYIINGKKITVK